MRRWLPYPVISATAIVIWLLLSQSLSPNQVLVGFLVALGSGIALTALEPPRIRMRRPLAILRLAGHVITDIARSNVAVARIILGAHSTRRKSDFMEIPLELRDPYGLAVLAIIITSAPGTLWVNHNPRTGLLMIHVLDLIDKDVWVRIIKQRYECLLMEIFE